MTGVVVVDANLMVLLVVGSASKEYIAKHKRLRDDYTVDDFELLGLIICNCSPWVASARAGRAIGSLAHDLDGSASDNP